MSISSAIICGTFLATALFGIALKASDSLAWNLVNNLMEKFTISESNLRELAHFAVKNDDVSWFLILISFVMAALSLIGSMRPACRSGSTKRCLDPFLFLLLPPGPKYTAVLIILLFVEVVVLAVHMAHPNKLAAPLLRTMKKLLQEYDSNPMARSIWKAVMEKEVECNGRNYSTCCGINDCSDFGEETRWLLRDRCKSEFISSTWDAKADAVPGCKGKLTACTAAYAKFLLCLSTAALLLQVIYRLLFVIAFTPNDGAKNNQLLSTFQNAFIVVVVFHLLMMELNPG
ncbi:unnamed protein product [Hydatigera taeniaeformis]|uniref:Tetraspanin n=1 Tax=Hydatigena taeniaeformis TaxID=6205 RepID=A0A0R3WJ55_HYDTA|nr:unnamed protein product [Hydatigera taeniaeformis]